MDPFIGQIIMFGGNFAPRGWAFCNGQLLPVAQNSALFSILGSTYGGDGRTTFALPELRGRAPIHAGTGPGLASVRLGERGGNSTTTLNINNLPSHTHVAETAATLRGAGALAGSTDMKDNMLAGSNTFVAPNGNIRAMAPEAISAETTLGNTGANLAFSNQSPYTGVNFIIALVGVFPSRS